MMFKNYSAEFELLRAGDITVRNYTLPFSLIFAEKWTRNGEELE